MLRDGLERRDWKRLSKGRKDGVGLPRPGREATDGNMLLPPGEESIEPCKILVEASVSNNSTLPGQRESHLVPIIMNRWGFPPGAE